MSNSIKGGKADKLTVKDIAKKFNVPVSTIEKQLAMGKKVEHEHTKDMNKVIEISMDHLTEFPDYYTRLEKMEKEAEKHAKKLQVNEDTKSLIKRLLRETLVSDEINALHGSPHYFDKFTTNKMGSGEGNQAFGWGLYFTDLEDIADKYKSSLSRKKNYELWLADTTVENKISQYYDILDKTSNSARYDEIQNKVKFLETLNQTWDYNKAVTAVNKPDIIAWANKHVKPYVSDSLGKTYKVTLHKGKTPEQYYYLNWYDKITPQVNDKLIAQAKKEGVLHERNGKTPVIRKAQTGAYFVTNDITIEELYHDLSQAFGSAKEASLFLIRCGIDGIRYPAESLSGVSDSRGFNYVVFDENNVSINDNN